VCAELARRGEAGHGMARHGRAGHGKDTHAAGKTAVWVSRGIEVKQ